MVHRVGLYARFVGRLLVGGQVKVPATEDVTAFTDWKPDALERTIEIAKAELQTQRERVDFVVTRAQTLFTTLLPLSALWITIVPKEIAFDSPPHCISSVLLLVTALLYLMGIAGAAAVIAIRKPYESISARVLATWHVLDLRRLARQYTEATSLGNHVADDHLTVFGTAVRLTLYGSVLFAVGWIVHFWG